MPTDCKTTLTTGLRAVATKLISPEFDELAKDEEVMGGRVDPLFNSTVSTVTKRGKVTLVSVSVDNSETSPDGTDDRLSSTLGALVRESLSNNFGSVNLVAVVVLFAVVIWFMVTVVAMAFPMVHSALEVTVIPMVPMVPMTFHILLFQLTVSTRIHLDHGYQPIALYNH